jgi:hypothetical protein
MKDHLQSSLDERLAALPRDIRPPRDLWTGIARSIDRGAVRSPRRARPMAFAAAAAVTGACLASALTWAVLHGRPAPAPAAIPVVAARAPSFDDVQTPRYIAARDSLEHTFRERLALLDPATRAQIESSLAVIHKAHEDIRKALATAPTSPVLEQLWESTWHDEVDLYDHVVRATQPTMTRT